MILPKDLKYDSKCQLVVLDTLVHKSEKFVERETIKVLFTGDYNFFKRCALISKSQAIVFTWLNAILVSLNDHS